MEQNEQENIEKKTVKFFNFRPLFFCAVFLSLGIFFGRMVSFSKYAIVFFLLVLVVGFGIVFLSGKHKKIFLMIAVLVLSFCAGTAAFFIQYMSVKSCPDYIGEHTISGVVVKKYDEEALSGVYLSSLTIDGKKSQGILVFYTEKTVRLNDKILFDGEMITDKNIEVSFWDQKAIYTAKKVRYVSIIGHQNNLFIKIRERLYSRLSQGMDKDNAAVFYAILTGDGTDIANGLIQNVRYGGIAHIFAVSGLHIGALYVFCLLISKKLHQKGIPTWVNFLWTAAILLFYGGICGFSASVKRAISMCLAASSFKLLGCKSDSLERVGFAAIVAILCNPVDLFSVGFQLSFGACLGIIFLSRNIEDFLCPYTTKIFKIFSRKKYQFIQPPYLSAAKNVSSFLAICISAQIFTFPILMANFGYLSLAGLFLNCLFVPLISAAFSLLIFMAFFCCIFSAVISGVLLYIPNLLLSLFLLVFYFVDFSALCVSFVLPVIAIVVWYLFALSLSEKIHCRKTIKKSASLIFLSAFFVLTILANL